MPVAVQPNFNISDNKALYKAGNRNAYAGDCSKVSFKGESQEIVKNVVKTLKQKKKAVLRAILNEKLKEKGIESKLLFNSELLKYSKFYAQADPISGNVVISPKTIMDNDIFNIHFNFAKKVLKHEAKHLEQYSLMGITDFNRLNKICAKKWFENFYDEERKEYLELAKSIKSGTITKEEQDSYFELNKYKIKRTNIALAYEALDKNPDCPAESIPVVINKEFYDKVKKTHGNLSIEEKEKAEKYFYALENYPDITQFSWLDRICPYTKNMRLYKSNLIEAEAIKAQNE